MEGLESAYNGELGNVVQLSMEGAGVEGCQLKLEDRWVKVQFCRLLESKVNDACEHERQAIDKSTRE